MPSGSGRGRLNGYPMIIGTFRSGHVVHVESDEARCLSGRLSPSVRERDLGYICRLHDRDGCQSCDFRPGPTSLYLASSSSESDSWSRSALHATLVRTHEQFTPVVCPADVFDPSPAGHEPMSIGTSSRDAHPTCIVYDGEVFEFDELRRDMERRGRQRASRAATEVILPAGCACGEGNTAIPGPLPSPSDPADPSRDRGLPDDDSPRGEADDRDC